jgi:hypothetical protein
VQEIINELDVIPNTNHSKQKTKKHNDDVDSITRSKIGHLVNFGDISRSKLQAICNSSGQDVFFPFYHVFMLKGH